jgi:hypothetical protein
MWFYSFNISVVSMYDCVSSLTSIPLLISNQLETDVFSFGGRSISSAFLRSTAVVHTIGALSGEDAIAFTAWYKALFDSRSEGIEDTILRSLGCLLS